ncbi:hypothetical protein D3C71_1196440 [compost metagenome]
MVSPASVTVGSAPPATVGAPAVLSSTSTGCGARVTTAESGEELTRALPGGVPSAVAVLVTVPLSISAWVMVCTPVQVPTASGPLAVSVVLSQVAVASRLVSITASADRLWLPVLVTTKV